MSQITVEKTAEDSASKSLRVTVPVDRVREAEAKAVKYYAKRQNIGLVLRFNGEPVDPNRRDDVLREINKPVVVQDQIDITPDVLALINRDQQNSGQAAPANGVLPQAARPTQIPR